MERAVQKKMCVIGSFNIDIMAAMDRFPKTGETIAVKTFDLQVGGGKGANQAVALGKLGADVMMVGKLGDQFYGPEYMEVLKKNGVSCSAVEVVPGAFPGAAFVAVDGNKDNVLFIYPGTNADVNEAYLQKNWDRISACDYFLIQLEIPMDTNRYLVAQLKNKSKVLILDPAPAKPLTEDLICGVDYITPNEVELGMLTDMVVETEEDFQVASRILLKQGVKTVIAKAGRRGAFIVTDTTFQRVPGYTVNTVDPTAAGDSFNAGFALALSEGKHVADSVRFANAVAALSTTKLGAQGAMPDRKTVETFMKAMQKS